MRLEVEFVDVRRQTQDTVDLDVINSARAEAGEAAGEDGLSNTATARRAQWERPMRRVIAVAALDGISKVFAAWCIVWIFFAQYGTARLQRR